MSQKTPGAKVLGCTYCGQTSMINADSLQAVGDKHLLIDYGSALSIGQSGTFEGRDFLLLGRLRIDYKDGFWDEWFVQFLDDGEEAWIQEDDGSFMLFREMDNGSESPDFESIQVGQTVSLSTGHQLFVTSKARAQVNGGEGELPFIVKRGDPADFIEGIAVGRGEVISIEVLPGETHAFIGYPFKLHELSLQP
ncbi:MAG: DUF4178 domain-containing protein [Bacteroidota bacterium]